MTTKTSLFSHSGYFTENTRLLFREKRAETGDNWILICEKFGLDIINDPALINRWVNMVMGQAPTPLCIQKAFARWLNS